jgi:protein-L-isoaspartate O-methyltransferase
MNYNSNQQRQEFLNLLAETLQQDSWIKLTLSKYRGNEKELLRITVRPVRLKGELALSFVYRYKTNDVTKNYSPDEAIALLDKLLGDEFKSALLSAKDSEAQCEISKKGKVTLRRKSVANEQKLVTEHNREKKRFVDVNRPYLTALGVTDRQQKVIPSMSRKWKQINKFIEIFSQALNESPLTKDTKVKNQPIKVVDFGSGKGYLTFAIHDYLSDSLQNPAEVVGVELRENLANLCSTAAQTLDHAGLSFVCGDVKTHAPKETDVMIALHACDVATDYAIHYGIRANASIIMCSPCCHKQVRPQMKSPSLLNGLLQYGVHLGQEAEMVTDSLRALLLEANGYHTKIFEFVSLEHTNKNKMILAVKKKNPGDNQKALAQIAELKNFYGIKEQCLESLLMASPAEE